MSDAVEIEPTPERTGGAEKFFTGEFCSRCLEGEWDGRTF